MKKEVECIRGQFPKQLVTGECKFTAMVLAADIVQGAHNATLMAWQTLVAMFVPWRVGPRRGRARSPLAVAHCGGASQGAVQRYGVRMPLWADDVVHWALLTAAVIALWLQVAQRRGVWPAAHLRS